MLGENQNIATRVTAQTKKVLPFILATAIFMQMVDSTILNTSLPAIAKDLNESPLHMQNAIISYVLTLAIFMPVSGYLADRFGTRWIFLISIFIFSLGSLLCALSYNLNYLVIARIVQGLGGALMTPVGRLALIKTFERNELLKAMNYAIIPALIGPILGPLVGGYFVDYLSWHWIFLINIPIGLIGIVMGWKYMPNFKTKNSYFDLKGFVIFAAASLLLSISLEMLGTTSNTSIVLIGFVSGFLMLYYYFRHAKRKERAIFPINLFQIRTFRVGVIGNLATRLGVSAIPLIMPLMIQISYGQSAIVSGWIVAPMALTAMFGKSAVIGILNKIGYKTTLRLNTTIIGVLIMCLAIPGIQTSIYWYVPLLCVLGFFNSIQFTAMNTISLANLRLYNTSNGNSFLSVSQQLAIGFGIAFGLIVLRFFENHPQIIHDNMHTAFRYTFLFLGFITIITGNIFKGLHNFDGNNMKSI